MNRYDIYGVGAALVDTEIKVSDDDLSRLGIEKGLMTLVDEERQVELLRQLQDHLVHSQLACGGSAANSIIAANHFGSRTYLSCKVANDEHGQFFLGDLRRTGVDVHARNGSADGTTGKCLVMITADAERTMNTFLGVSETLGIDDIDETALAQSRYLYLEGYLVTSASGKPAAIAATELARRNGVQIALSLSDPGIVQYFKAGLREIVGSGVDLLFCNEAEALAFTEEKSLENACSALKHCARSFAITCGARGALVFDGQRQYSLAAEAVKAVDTNGAGDMFAGAFLHAIARGFDYERAALFANRAAAQVVTQYGPRLTREQCQQLTQP